MGTPFLVTKSAKAEWDNWYLVVSRKRLPSGKRGADIFFVDRLGRNLVIGVGKRSLSMRLPKWA